MAYARVIPIHDQTASITTSHRASDAVHLHYTFQPIGSQYKSERKRGYSTTLLRFTNAVENLLTLAAFGKKQKSPEIRNTDPLSEDHGRCHSGLCAGSEALSDTHGLRRGHGASREGTGASGENLFMAQASMLSASRSSRATSTIRRPESMLFF